jgi:DNA-binding XRE family transcriptional regulator
LDLGRSAAVAIHKSKHRPSSSRRRGSTAARAKARAKTAGEKKWLEQFLEERDQLVRIAASVMKQMRQEADVKQVAMAERLMSSDDAIGNLENAVTEASMADAVFWALALGQDPAVIFDRFIHRVRELYAKKTSVVNPNRSTAT